MSLRTSAEGMKSAEPMKRLAAAVIIQALDDARFIHRIGLRNKQGRLMRNLGKCRDVVGRGSLYARCKRIIEGHDPELWLRAGSVFHDALDVDPEIMTDEVLYGDELAGRLEELYGD